MANFYHYKLINTPFGVAYLDTRLFMDNRGYVTDRETGEIATQQYITEKYLKYREIKTRE